MLLRSFCNFLLRNEALRVAFIHTEEVGAAGGKVTKEFYSKLVKADAHGKDQVEDFVLNASALACFPFKGKLLSR